MKSNPTVAIVGVTGAVGAEFMATMDRRKFPVGRLKALGPGPRGRHGQWALGPRR